ncbi:MAG: hypothetical protein WBA16_10505 [Nonlabens sp.]
MKTKNYFKILINQIATRSFRSRDSLTGNLVYIKKNAAEKALLSDSSKWTVPEKCSKCSPIKWNPLLVSNLSFLAPEELIIKGISRSVEIQSILMNGNHLMVTTGRKYFVTRIFEKIGDTLYPRFAYSNRPFVEE